MLTEDQLEEKKAVLETLSNKFPNIIYKPASGRNGLFHYSSISTLFSMLENDSFRVNGTRFSNDSSEERVFPLECTDKHPLNDDNYMFCLSENGDCLSQWRGYCYNGGAAMKLKLSEIQDYSVLHADFDTTGEYEIVKNVPLPICYVTVPKMRRDRLENAQIKEYQRKLVDIWNQLNRTGLPMESLVPQFKNDKFQEEKELRLLFENYDNELAQCIRFHTLKNCVKVPYMVVKMGDVAKKYKRCGFDVSQFEGDDGRNRLLKEYVLEGKNIRIPQGSDQASVYYRMERIIKKFNAENDGVDLILECEGHLPVEEIIVAPTYDRERKAEQIQRYCWSKYWLRNVKINYSDIPYIPPSEL